MTSENLEDEYPHWRDALFGNHDAVANLRCAAHYVFWHSVYALIALAGVLVVGLITAGKIAAPLFGPLEDRIVAGLVWLHDGASRVANHRWTELAAEAGVIVLFLGGTLYLVGMLLFFLYTHFWATAGAILGAVVGTLLLFGAVVVFEILRDPVKRLGSKLAVGARTAGERAVETPGVRRVYGECPVSLDQAPRWFDQLFPDE